MIQDNLLPDYLFESSWEVCNKVGGIYTVLSTRAKTMQDTMHDRVFFIGPDVWQNKENPLFVEDPDLFADWRKQASKEALVLRVGRWQIPGNPIAILVDFTPFYAIKDDLYGSLWRDFGVDSLHSYGDYDEASMFSYAAGRVVESFFAFYLRLKADAPQPRVVYQAHEWMTGLGALYLQKHVPSIATIFTTHATTVGRSIAGNGKPLYDYLFAYNGNQMADELNVQSKHSIERQTAHCVDCFTTVSDVTARECLELLDKQPDVVLPNGFEMDFVPKGQKYVSARRKARRRIFEVAQALMGCPFSDDTLIVGTSGRYEWKNKGIDVYLEGISRLRSQADALQRPVLALVEVPAWQAGPREDLVERLSTPLSSLTPSRSKTTTPPPSPLPDPFVTHVLREPWNDPATNFFRAHDFQNLPDDRVKVMFIPCYLDGNDGIFNLHYYDFLVGLDLSVYPSYYEPWGYTPLESVAFQVPCLTTSLAGFGLWAEEEKSKSATGKSVKRKSECHLDTDGVEVITRTDYNYDGVAERIASEICGYAALDKKQTDIARKAAAALAQNALWKNFFQYYQQAYTIALRNAAVRNTNP